MYVVVDNASSLCPAASNVLGFLKIFNREVLCICYMFLLLLKSIVVRQPTKPYSNCCTIAIGLYWPSLVYILLIFTVTLVVFFPWSPLQFNTDDPGSPGSPISCCWDSDELGLRRAHIPEASCHGTFRIVASWTMIVGRVIGPWFWPHMILLRRDLTGGAAAAAAANVDILNPGCVNDMTHWRSLWKRANMIYLKSSLRTFMYIHIWHIHVSK